MCILTARPSHTAQTLILLLQHAELFFDEGQPPPTTRLPFEVIARTEQTSKP